MKKKNALKIKIYLGCLITLLIIIILTLHYIKEKSILLLTDQKINEISKNIEDKILKELKRLKFRKTQLNFKEIRKEKYENLSWSLKALEVDIPKGINLERCKRAVFASIGRTKGKVINFQSKEDKRYFYLIFNIGVIKYQTHKLIFKKRKIPKIAIIIDDVGNSLNKELFTLNKNITFSILSNLLNSKKIASIAHEKGYELMLHLPMEPHGYPLKGKDPGAGAIFINMSRKEIFEKVEEALEKIPYIKGVNNHMGSKATENKKVMEVVLDKIKKHNLYFVDSLTSNKSIAYKLALKKNIPCGKRDIFLDSNQELENIKSQLKKLIRIAKLKGEAIAIGHAHCKNTLKVLKEIDSLLKREEVKLVKVSMLLKKNF